MLQWEHIKAIPGRIKSYNGSAPKPYQWHIKATMGANQKPQWWQVEVTPVTHQTTRQQDIQSYNSSMISKALTVA